MQTYNPKGIYDCDEKIRRVVDTLVNGTLNDGGSGLFAKFTIRFSTARAGPALTTIMCLGT